LGLKVGIWGMEARIWVLRVGFELQGWDLDLEDGIWVGRDRGEGEGKNFLYV